MYSRRDFGKLAITALPLSAVSSALAARINSKIDGVELGTQSYSFRTVSLDDAIPQMAEDGCGYCELFAPHIEPPALCEKPATGGFGGGRGRGPGAPGGRRGPVDPAVIAARQKAREDLRQWRKTVDLSYFKGVRKKFDDAGIQLVAYNYSFNDSFDDDEIDRGFAFAKALGVNIITASTTVTMAKKLVPFTDKHKMLVAFHGHSDIKDPNQFAKPEAFAAALAMSKYYRINLDIGHFTAAGYDPVSYIKEHHDKIVILHLKDRKKDEGPNTPWGEGDTKIKEVLLELKDNKWSIPALIEYEYQGTGTPKEEVAKCMAFAKNVLQNA